MAAWNGPNDEFSFRHVKRDALLNNFILSFCTGSASRYILLLLEWRGQCGKRIRLALSRELYGNDINSAIIC